MKLNDTISATITKENTVKLKDNTTKAVINLTIEELQQVVKLYEKEQEKQLKQDKINAKIKECAEHGFTVKKERDWLWLTETDNRYNETVINNTTMLGIPKGTELISKDKETEILLSLGFQYSSWRMGYYWDSTK